MTGSDRYFTQLEFFVAHFFQSSPVHAWRREEMGVATGLVGGVLSGSLCTRLKCGTVSTHGMKHRLIHTQRNLLVRLTFALCASKVDEELVPPNPLVSSICPTWVS